MEPVRPKVDAVVLQLLESHTCAAHDFFQTRQGVCRLLPPLTQLLAETQPRWAKALAPVAEGVMRALFQPERRAATRDRSVPTLLTEANRSAGRDGLRRKAKSAQPSPALSLTAACRDCGVLLDGSTRSFCDDCLPERFQESISTFSEAGPRALAELRAEGRDPAHGGEAGQRRGRRHAEHVRAIQEWDPEQRNANADIDFPRDIFPRLQQFLLSTIMEATGLSLRYCSIIRRGLKVPHPRHWQALAHLNASQSEKDRLVEEERESIS